MPDAEVEPIPCGGCGRPVYPNHRFCSAACERDASVDPKEGR